MKYRPGYPEAIVDLLKREYQLTRDSVIADVGSGTGILSGMFLKNDNRVYGVEPNAEMRRASERTLSRYPRFVSIDGTAESTTLEDRGTDFVTAAQSFHWFDRKKAREEFARILKASGCVVVIWNDRRTHSSPFLADYEDLLQRYGTDYREVDHKKVDNNQLGEFFAPGRFTMHVFENSQALDFDGLKGRLESSSYIPEQSHPVYDVMIADLAGLFSRHQKNGRVTLEYDTRVFVGRFTK